MTTEIGFMLLAILPEIGLLVLAGLVLLLDLLGRASLRRSLGWVTAAGLLVLIGLALVYTRPPAEPQLIWGEMLRVDAASYVFRLIFLAGAALTALFAIGSEGIGQRGEFFILLLTSTLGMSLMASSADLIMLFLAIETTSVPLFVMTGFLIRDKKSVEAGLKYLLFGVMTAVIMLYGFTWLYGFTGTTQIYRLGALLSAGEISPAAIAVVALLVLVGFGFKISAVPFHFWAPDVYEGAPSPVAGFLSTASKAAGFVVLMRVFLTAFPDLAPTWMALVAALAVLSMVLGNFLALAQKNIKRLLAYSSIAQAGYILIGVAADSQLGTTGAVYYLIAYLVTNLAAFGIVTVVGRTIGSDEISAYAGLSRRAPGLALAMGAAMLSLGGIPPFAGFIGKLLVFAAAVEANMVWLALVGLLNSIVALYYYLVVLKVIYAYRSEDEDKPVEVPRPWALALTLSVFGILLLGTIYAPWYGWAKLASTALLGY